MSVAQKTDRNGLTADQRRESYDPKSWSVERLTETQIAATCKNDRWLLFTVAWGRIFSVATDRGTEYELVIGCCCCPDAANGALNESRHCAHAAAAEAVEEFLAAECRERSAEAIERQAAAQADINAVFGAEAIQHPMPAGWCGGQL